MNIRILASALILFSVVSSPGMAGASGGNEQFDFMPISDVSFIEFDGTPTGISIDEEELRQLTLFLEIPIDVGVIEPEVIPSEDQQDKWQENYRINILTLLHRETSELAAEGEDFLSKVRYLVFSSEVIRLESAHLNNVGGILVEIAKENSEAASLVNDIYVQAGQIATNFVASVRTDRIRERVEADVRDGLKTGRYDVAILMELKGSDSPLEAYAKRYSVLDEDVQRSDAEWILRVTRAVENNIRLGILRAVQRTDKPYFAHLVTSAMSEPDSSPIYRLLH